MALDIRINSVDTDFNVVDASTLLTPAVREQLVREVLRALNERMRVRNDLEREMELGSERSKDQQQ